MGIMGLLLDRLWFVCRYAVPGSLFRLFVAETRLAQDRKGSVIGGISGRSHPQTPHLFYLFFAHAPQLLAKRLEQTSESTNVKHAGTVAAAATT